MLAKPEPKKARPSFDFPQWTPDHTMEALTWFEDDPEMVAQIGFESPEELVNGITKMMLTQNDAICAAIEPDGALVGYVAATNIQQTGWANVHIGVAPKHRGKGIQLMREGLQLAFNKLGLNYLTAAVPRGRPKVERFHRHFGFTEPEAKILILSKTSWEERNG
jgi:RimJ/RimL family protein N-acetyltransferase